MKASIWFITFFILSLNSGFVYGEDILKINAYDSMGYVSHIKLKPIERIIASTIVPKMKLRELTLVKRDIEVNNTTEYDLEFLIQWVGAHLGLRGIKINVYSLPKKLSHEGVLVKGENEYNLHLKKNLPHFKLIVIHEMIHVKQYEFEELEVINKTTVHFNGRRIDLNRIDYNLRPYENEAHSKDQHILRLFNQYMKRKSKREKYENTISPKENEKSQPPATITKGCRKVPII